MITWNKTPTFYTVSGPYNEMVELNQKLKRKGFRWDAGKKVWYCSVDRLSEADWDKLQGKVAPKAPKPGKKPVDPGVAADLFDLAVRLPLKRIQIREVGMHQGVEFPDLPDQLAKTVQKAGGSNQSGIWKVLVEHLVPKAFKDLLEEVQKTDQAIDEAYQVREELLEEARRLSLIGFQFQAFTGGVYLVGDTRSLSQLCKQAGGTWGGEKWTFSKATLNIEAFKELLKELVQASNRLAIQEAKETERMEALFKKAEGRWPAMGVAIHPNQHKPYGFVLRGDTRAIKDKIRAENMSWEGTAWYPKLPYFTSENMENLLHILDDQEDRVKSAPPAEKSAPPQKVNRHPGQCARCGLWVPAGEGYLQQRFNDDEDEWEYVVVHQDTKTCEAARAQAKELQRLKHERQRSKDQALAALRQYVQKEGTSPVRPSGPPGRKLMIDDTSVGYGGGLWVVIEPDETFFWLVRGNSADGDDWEHNNLPGAIGTRAAVTPDTRVWIEILTGEKV